MHASVVEWINNYNYIKEHWAAMKIDEKRICNNWMNLKKYNVEQRSRRMYTVWLPIYKVHTGKIS